MQYMNLRPSQVILDPENPRLPDGTSNDREAVNRLLDEGADLVSLARDLAKTGQANPAELPIAIKNGSKYLILEGNRRFAALKLLKDPTLADDEENQKLFRRAALLGTPPATVHTLIMTSREEADHWIVLRHTGENNGVGVKRWSANQTATHRRRANKTIDSGTLRSIVIADTLEEVYATDREIAELVRQVRRGKLTNIGRLFSPEVLNALHFSLRADDATSLDTKALFVCHTAGQLREFFAWAFAYIRDNPVDAYKNAEIRQELLRSVAYLLPSLTDAAAEPFRLADRVPAAPSSSSKPGSIVDESEDGSVARGVPEEGSGENSGSANDGVSPLSETGGATDANGEDGRPKKNEVRPEKYLFQGLKLPNHPALIQRLLRECRSLPMEDHPGVACIMIRVLVELSLSCQPALALSGASERTSLREKIICMLKYLDPDIEHPTRRDRELAQAYLEASNLGVQYLNSFVHNPNVGPDQHLARRFSKAFRPLLVRVDEKL